MGVSLGLDKAVCCLSFICLSFFLVFILFYFLLFSFFQKKKKKRDPSTDDWLTLLSSSLYIYLDGPPSIDLPCKFFFIHKYFSLSLLQVPLPADFFSYFDPISPYQLHPSLPFAILLSQPALPPPSLPFFPTLLLPTSLAIHRIWLFLFPSFNPGSDGVEFRAAFLSLITFGLQPPYCRLLH